MAYKKLRNEVTRQLRIADTAFWKEHFSKAKTSNEFWAVVNKLKRKQKDHRIGPLKEENDNLVTDDRGGGGGATASDEGQIYMCIPRL